MAKPLTLEQLKAMSNEQLEDHWSNGEFPLDKLSCGICLTEHGSLSHLHVGRPCEAVKEAVLAMRHWECRRPTGAELRPHLEELFALRLFYDSLYPQSKRVTSPETRENAGFAKEADDVQQLQR